MSNATQETVTEAKAPTLESAKDFSEYERIRNGEKVEATQSAPEDKISASETTDDSDTSETEVEDSEVDSDEGKDADEALETDKPKKKSGSQRRIEKLVKERETAKQAKELAERERDALREEMLKSKAKPDAKSDIKPDGDQEPVDSDFENYNDYIKAWSRWDNRQQRNAEKAESEKRSLEAKAQETVKTHNEKMDAYKKEHTDFDDLYHNFEADHPDFDLANSVKYSIADSEVGPQLLHELLKNPEEFIRINSLDPYDAARAIGRLEAKLSSTSEKQKSIPVKTTKAPAPVAPIGRTASTVTKSLYDANNSFAEYEKIRLQQMKNNK